jgi:hypothetical protein
MWPFGSSSSDAANKLDPDLRVFLDEDATSRSTPQSQHPSTTLAIYSQLPKPNGHKNSKEVESHDSSTAAVPPQSLYPDGRYAHLWKTYQTPNGQAAKSSNEKLRDLKEASQVRSASIEQTAKENCALEAQAEVDCFNKGGWRNKLTLCRTETRALDRCTQLQAKFLRALGYMSVPGRTLEEEERIQMHADDLYQQMLKHEHAVKEAKEQGIPQPEFKPVMSRENIAKVLGIRSGKAVDIEENARKAGIDVEKLVELKEKQQKKLDEKWKNLTPEERVAEEAALISRIQEKEYMVRDYTEFMKEKQLERHKRKEEGKESVADQLHGWWWNEKK